MSSSTSGGGASAPGEAARSSLQWSGGSGAERAGRRFGGGSAWRICGAAPSRTHATYPFDVGARPRYAAAQRHARAAGSNWKQPAPAAAQRRQQPAPSASVVCPRLSAPRQYWPLCAAHRAPAASAAAATDASAASRALASPRADAPTAAQRSRAAPPSETRCEYSRRRLATYSPSA